MYYRCKHFAIHELVPPEYYNKWGERCWSMLDERILITLDALREQFGSITVNNYFWKGNRTQSGIRSVVFYGSMEKYNNSRSQHKYGRAIDALFKNVSAKEVRKYILEHPEQFPYITFMECGTSDEPLSWLHIDVRNCNPVQLWSPTLDFITKEEFFEMGGC